MILNYSKSKLRDFNIYIFLGLFYFYITNLFLTRFESKFPKLEYILF